MQFQGLYTSLEKSVIKKIPVSYHQLMTADGVRPVFVCIVWIRIRSPEVLSVGVIFFHYAD